MSTLVSSAPPSPSSMQLRAEQPSSPRVPPVGSAASSKATAAQSCGTCPPAPPYAKSLSPTPSLKRARSTSVSITMDSELPPAPQIDGEAMLEIFVHSSIRFAGLPLNSDSPYGDGARLAALGSKMLEAAFTHALFNQRPMRTAEEIQAEVDNIGAYVEKWVAGYRWREKVRHAKDVDLSDPKETRYIMDAYVGAVHVGGGFPAVLKWITALVDPNAQVTAAPSEPKRPRIEPHIHQPYSPYPSYPSYPSQPPAYMSSGMPSQPPAPPPPSVPPPPLPTHAPPYTNYLAPAQPQSAFLPLFNQTAQQRRLEVQYPAEFSGPPHAGRWTVKCVVNGIERGVGTGTSKQLAKEEAARQAYHAMGWAPRV